MNNYITVLMLLVCCCSCNSFNVAVYEHAVILPETRIHVVTKSEAMDLMKKNLKIYQTQAKKAKEQNVSILVFPENGLYGPHFLREALWPYTEYIPDPETVKSWNPCSHPNRFSHTEIQHFLSCLAKNNSLYIVANVASIEPCEGSGCPKDQHFQYSTNVVYDDKGKFVARYLKPNVMDEEQFDAPEKADAVSFKTSFGKFGLVTSWDLLFHDPVMTLVEDLKIKNLILLASWKNTYPFLTSVHFHSAFALRMKVNVMAANLHLPEDNFLGSGIYTPGGHPVYYYNNTESAGRLLVSKLDEVSENPSLITYDSQPEVQESNHSFRSRVNYDNFTLVRLTQKKGNSKVCQKSVCCSLKYSLKGSVPQGNQTFAFGVFDGLHTHQSSYYIQACTLLTCKTTNNGLSCGSNTTLVNSTFTDIRITGTSFRTKYVYPELLVSVNGVISLGSFEFGDYSLTVKNTSVDLVSANLFARVYTKRTNEASSVMITKFYLLLVFVSVLPFLH